MPSVGVCSCTPKAAPTVQLFLTALGTPPADAIDYQLWIQNHTDVGKSATLGKFE